MQLRSILKIGPTEDGSGPDGPAQVIRIAKDTKDVERWIDSIGKLHESHTQNSANVLQMISASSKQPEIERLMQELPTKLEQLINSNELLLPDKELDCDLDEFISIICGKQFASN